MRKAALLEMAASMRKAAMALVLVCLAVVSQGCGHPAAPPPVGANLTGVPLWTDPGVSMPLRQEQTLSPDGSSLLLTLQEPTTSGPRSVSVAAYSFTDQWKHPAVFFSAGQDWVKDYNLAMPLGWVADRSCLFLDREGRGDRVHRTCLWDPVFSRFRERSGKSLPSRVGAIRNHMGV